MTQMDIKDILGELQDGPMLSNHRGRINACMKHFHAAGLSLETCSDARHLNRSVSTLKGYARELQLRFSDYVPMSLMTPEELKEFRHRKKKSAAAAP